MIELPLTPSFFKKLGIFQDLSDKELTSDKKPWEYEKALLIWTVKNHQHLASSISRDYVRDRLKELGFQSTTVNDLAPKVMGNLCKRGYAVAIDVKSVEDKDYQGAGRLYKQVKTISTITVDSPAQIVFTQEGLLAGKVLSEMEKNWWGRYRYNVFIWLFWIILAVLFIDTIIVKLWGWFAILDIKDLSAFLKIW